MNNFTNHGTTELAFSKQINKPSMDLKVDDDLLDSRSSQGSVAAAPEPAAEEGQDNRMIPLLLLHQQQATILRKDREDRAALGGVVLALRDYRSTLEADIARWRRNLAHMPQRHQELLRAQLVKYEVAERCVGINQCFITAMLKVLDDEGGPSYLLNANSAGDEAAAQQPTVSTAEVEMVDNLLKNLVRDWSAEGAQEREECYTPIIKELAHLFRGWPSDAPPPRVLLPGAGLGRLCCEVAGMGYQAQGNEFSVLMLLAASFILNHSSQVDQYQIHPWVLSSCNQLSDQGQLRAVRLPDRLPVDVASSKGLLSMCAGDFVDVYSAGEYCGAFDSVVTCFFIDTAHNIVEYIEVICHCLRPGGWWINLGPLLYHWNRWGQGQPAKHRQDQEASAAEADAADLMAAADVCVELSLEEVLNVSRMLGFRLIRNEIIKAPYIVNAQSMFRTSYDAAFWTMIKET